MRARVSGGTRLSNAAVLPPLWPGSMLMRRPLTAASGLAAVASRSGSGSAAAPADSVACAFCFAFLAFLASLACSTTPQPARGPGRPAGTKHRAATCACTSSAPTPPRSQTTPAAITPTSTASTISRRTTLPWWHTHSAVGPYW